MTLVISELGLRRTSLVIWTVAVGLLVLMVAEFYPSIANDPSLNSLYEGLSPSVQALLGGSDATSPAGYLSTQLYAFFLPAVLLVFMLGRSAATIAGEEEDRTLDLLMSQPVARWSVYVQKALAATVGLLILSGVSFAVLWAVNAQVGFNLSASNLLAVNTQMFLFCLALGLWAQAIATFTGRKALGLAIVIGYVVVSYLVYGLGQSVDVLKHLMPLSLWRWYLENSPLTSGFGWMACVVMLLAGVVALVVGAALFERRDLHA